MVLKYKQALRGLFTAGTSLPRKLREKTKEKVGGKQGLNSDFSFGMSL